MLSASGLPSSSTASRASSFRFSANSLAIRSSFICFSLMWDKFGPVLFRDDGWFRPPVAVQPFTVERTKDRCSYRRIRLVHLLHKSVRFLPGPVKQTDDLVYVF